MSKSTSIPIQQPDMVELDNSDLDGNAMEVDKGDEAAFAATLKTSKTSNLFMHNSFDILNEEDTLNFGEARQPAMSQGANLINKQIFGAVPKHNIVVFVPKQVVVPVDSLVNNNEWVTLDNFDEERPIKEGGNVEVAEISAIQKQGDASTLPLCNYFAPLHEDCERPSGEEKLDENDTNKLFVNTLLESAEIMDRVSKEMACLYPVSQSKVSDVVENVSIESAILNTKHTMTVGKTLISNEPCSKTGTLPLTHFNTESGTNSDMSSAILEKVPDVITVYEEMLRPDKGKISAPSTVTNTAAACRKDEKILTKFWADALETALIVP